MVKSYLLINFPQSQQWLRVYVYINTGVSRCYNGAPRYLLDNISQQVQCIVLCALLFSISVDAFGSCADDSDCPDNAECDNNGDDDDDCESESCEPVECECKEGFDEIDLPKITIDGRAATVCVGMKQ